MKHQWHRMTDEPVLRFVLRSAPQCFTIMWMKGLHAVSLDLDDTLWDLSPVLIQAEHTLYRWLSEHCPRVTARYSLAAMRGLRAQVLARYPRQAHDMTFLRQQVLNASIVDAGYPAALAQHAFEVFMAARNQVTLFDGARGVLEALSERYVLLALTNGNADLRRIGLAQYFAHELNPARVGVPKPDRAMFDRALELTGLSAQQIVHVGDDPVTDVRGASQAGWRTIWFNRQAHNWSNEGQAPTAQVSDLYQLKTLLGC